jgi:P27 family predicted phage terminase small subunit
MKSHDPPAHLARPGRELWRQIQDQFVVADAGGLALLTVACEALDRCRQAQTALLEAGSLTVVDQRGALKTHPAVTIERDAWGVMSRALKQLNLDVLPAGNPGRPATRR